MAAFKTVQFLPEIFRTDTNRKFLNATTDQLVSETNLTRINGYIGRKLAPSYKSTDSYITEPTKTRQDYQLEPSILIKDPITGEVTFATTYNDIINKINFYGGYGDNHTRLFDNEYYSYNPQIDLDKFVNFSQYYWLPNGPDTVTVTANTVPLERTFELSFDSISQVYKIAGFNDVPNPVIILARGGTYTFTINEPGNKFYIQTSPGVLGVDPNAPNLATRTILGVTGNGTDSGSVSFQVPTPASQVQWTTMPLADTADYATNLSYQSLQGCLVSDLQNVLGGLDGPTNSLEDASLIFVNNQFIDDTFWYNTARLENNVIFLDQNTLIPLSQRNDVYKINVYLDDQDNPRIYLTNKRTVLNEQKVRVTAGAINAGREYYSRLDIFSEVPALTAPLTQLYYQSDQSSDAVGIIQFIDPASAAIDPATEIIGQPNYTSPNGIIFTNGLKIAFDSTASSPYAGNTYYVEGVGEAINLILTTDLVGPELNNDLSKQDYLTINRNSIDLNGWSRTNRWFHVDVIQKTAQYLNVDLSLNQPNRAQRPIIEFVSNLQLFNFGTEAKNPVDILDDVITNAYTQVQGVISASASDITITVNGRSVTFTDGDRIIFSQDENLEVRNKIYNFSIVLTTEAPDPLIYRAYFAEADDTLVQDGHTIIVKSGDNGSKQWYFNGTRWIEAQQKTSVNQAPLFDVINTNGLSFADFAVYPGSQFSGTKIFSYKQGTGTVDPVLGFPLSYKNLITQGDIQFENNFDLDTFTYLLEGGVSETVSVNVGLLQKNISRDTSTRVNTWTINSTFSKQYQIFDFVYNGTTNLFPVDILPDLSVDIPNIKITVNNQQIANGEFAITKAVDKLAILINPDLLTVGDVIFISIYNSSSASTQAYYQVPVNLDINSLNTDIELLTLGQLRNHLIEFKNNSIDIIGDVPGSSNLRDLFYLNRGGGILQHSAPIVYAGLFLNSPTLNFVDALRLASREYSQFKIKFLEAAANLQLDRTNIAQCVDDIMSAINAVKNDSFPWHYSDMVAHGDDEKVTLPTYTVFDTDIRSYEITNIFQDTELSNKAVFVYLTRTLDEVTTTTLLVKGQDYYFDQTRPAVVIQDSFNLLYNDKLTVVEYNNTDGSYVPETPTKLGLYPKFAPEIFLDNTYRTPIYVIQGHDGSITPAFNDFRDQLLLELERRIYNNIKSEYNINNFNINDYFPGKFRILDYTLQEFNQLLSKSFLRWVGTNRVDFTANNTFVASDAFTWNYKKFRDVINGESLPGTWRSIFRYFFDTDRPHTHPWEMLGFSLKPDYWNDRYGPAPYTGGNFLLWSDLESGYIHEGDRAGIDLRYSRPGLTSIIPVDENGNLRNPSEFLVTDFDSANANTSFAVGDIGPTELAWRRSSDFPYAIQYALAIGKPARYFALTADIKRYVRSSILGQFIDTETNQHLKPTTLRVNGYVSNNGTIERSSGYLNWIRDLVKNTGVADAGTIVKESLNSIQVQLTYKMGGYSDKRFLEILAEQVSPSSINDSVVVPEENYTIELYKGAPTNKVVYSAVVVERSVNGYTVSGYDTNNPYFSIIPSLPNNNSYVIDVGGERGVIYRDAKNQILSIPYGFEFNSKQQIVDFLVGYQRYLITQGFVFQDRENSLNATKDWVLSAREFLNWTNQGWRAGNILVLSPVSDNIKIFNDLRVVDEIVNTPSGSRILDINFTPIVKNNFTIARENNLFSLQTLNEQTIGFAEFNLVQFEHILIFDNTTVFRDIIYLPETGNRQFRLKLIGSKTALWNGSLELPGFIFSGQQLAEWQPGIDYLKGSIVKHKERIYAALDNITADEEFQVTQWKLLAQNELKYGVINNFATNASQSLRYYDINDQPLDEKTQIFSNGLIGFRPRQYFTNLGIDITTQSKFYQGLIKQGGTTNAINALKGAQFNNLSTELDFFENWAVRVGEYGALDVNQFIEFVLSDSEFDNNPAVFQVSDTISTSETDVTTFTSTDVYKSNGEFSVNFLRTESKDLPVEIKPLPTAGFVNLDDINNTIFDISDYEQFATMVDNIGVGYTIWTARDFDGQWNVYRATTVPGLAFILRYSVDNQAQVVMSAEHGLEVNNLIVLKNFDARYNGLYQVTAIVDSTRFLISIYNNLQDLIDQDAILGNGIVYQLKSSRLSTPTDVIQNIPNDGWQFNDKVWVDTLDNQGNWAVYNKTDPWQFQDTINLGESQYSGQDHFGRAVTLDNTGLYLYGGAPESGSGRVSIFARNASDVWDPYGFLWGNSSLLDSFGKALAAATIGSSSYLIVAAPDSASGKGVVYVFLNQVLIQILADATGSVDDLYGATLAISDNANYLYVGSPGADKVFCYTLNYPRDALVQNIVSSGATDYTLNFSVTDPTYILVNNSLNGAEYFPYINYSFGTATQGITSFTSTGTATGSAATYSGVSASGGTGTGAVFFVEKLVNESAVLVYEVVLENAGTGYTATNTLTIPGTSLGGASPANDITVTVGTVGTVTNLIFSSAPTSGEQISIVQRTDFYTLLETFPLASENIVGSNFGCSLACNADGSTIAIGASDTTVNSLPKTGAVHVYHRTVTEIITNGLTNTFTLPDNLATVYRVFLNGTLIYDLTNAPAGVTASYTKIGSNTIQYGDPGIDPLPAGNRILIETNQFIFDQTIYPQQQGLEEGMFGTQLSMCNTGCNLYISSPGYFEPNYRTGIVTRFVNVGRVYGVITGTITNPTVTINDSIVINNRVVTFTGTSLNVVVSNINAANIPGVSASNVNGKLQIVSDVTVEANKLNVVSGNTGIPLQDLGIEQYKYVQIIKHPDTLGEVFGTAIKVDQASNTLAIGSDGADITIDLVFDSTLATITSFDSGGTKFADVITDSGAVYIFNLMPNPYEDQDNPALFAYSQKLVGPNLETGFNFGAAIDLKSEYLLVGVSNDYNVVSGGGSVYYYFNNNAKSGWELIRYKEPRVDIGAISSAFLYNIVSQNILDFYDYLDPVKGKLLGAVDQELDYKESYDPASYNKAGRLDTINNVNFYWSDRQVGRTWWDLSTVSFIDYEQDTIQYRVKNWSSLFPGSIVTIYEWIESDFLPSQYVDAVGDGTPKYVDDSAYTSVTLVDPATGIINQKYYYWVSGKTSVDVNIARRSLSVSALESYIINPKDQGIPYLALLAPNAVAIYNTTDRLVGDNVVIHIDKSPVRNTNLLHNEWQLVPQGASAESIPARVITKLKDSLTGFDSKGFQVPDPLLNSQDKLGILNNPIQSLVSNRLTALQNYVETLNNILIQYPILLISTPSTLFVEDPLPTTGFDTQTDSVIDLTYLDTAAFPDGYKILIPSDSNYQGKWSIYSFDSVTDSFALFRLQSFKTNLFWNPIDWYSSAFQNGKDINYTINIYSDIQALILSTGDYVKVLDGGQGKWLLYEAQSDNTLELIGAEDGTVEISASVYDVSIGAGYDSVVYDSTEFDPQAVKELQNIYDSVYQEILIGNLGVEFNKLFLTIINYIFAEQKNPDWIFKTSFIDVFHKLRALEQFPSYVRDNQSFYDDYINEVKPYRTQVREYVPSYFRQDLAEGNWTDFDLPSAYDSRSKTFRSPDVALSSDSVLLTSEPYSDWYNNYKFKITDYIIGNIGLNYTLPPNVEIRGGGGTGAEAITTLFGNGTVATITVTNPGSGYTTTPNVFINGDGVGATAYPILKNEFYAPAGNLSLNYLSYNLVRSVDTILKFDRIDYQSNLVLWQPNTAYANTVVTVGNVVEYAGNLYISSGNIVVYNNQAYLATNANVSTESIFDFTRFSQIDSGNVLLNALDRIIAYYEPKVGMPGKDLTQLVNGIGYPGNFVTGADFRANAFEIISNVISFDYEGLTINSGNIRAVDFIELGFEVDNQIRVEALVPFEFQNNGYFSIVNVNRDSMTLTGQPVETTYKIFLDNAITANAGDYVTQSNTLANAVVLQSVSNSNELDVIYVVPDFILASNISINGLAVTANIADVTTGGNVNVKIDYLDQEYFVDANIYSNYLDSNLGIRSQDINIVGGAYVDTYASYAPEELIPGRMYDTLELRVFSNTLSNTATYGYRMFQPMSGNILYTRISDNATTVLTANLDLADDEILLDDVSGLPEPNPALGVPGIVFINGERVVYYQKYDAAKLATAIPWIANTVVTPNTLISLNSNVYLTLGNVYANTSSNINSANIQLVKLNSLRQLRRGVDGTGIPQQHLGRDWTVYSYRPDYLSAIDSETFVTSSQDPLPSGLYFRDDGLKMYMAGQGNDDVYEFTLATAWDISTASNVGAFSVAIQESQPTAFYFKSDGTKMYVVGVNTNNVHEYDLSTPWQVNSASYVSSLATNFSGLGISSLTFDVTGSELYLMGFGNNRIIQYTMSNTWQTNTASYTGLSSNLPNISGNINILFNVPSSNNIMVLNQTSNKIYSYNFGTAGNVVSNVTLQFSSNQLVNNSLLSGMYWDSLGRNIYLLNRTSNQITKRIVDLDIFDSVVSDSSLAQIIPNAQVFVSPTISGNVKVTANVTYKLALSSTITANIGDYITQFANTGNARVLESVTNANVIAVDFVTGIFQTGSNVGTRINLVSLTNGISSINANVISQNILGSVYANGNVVLNSVSLFRSNIWEQFGTTLQNSTTIGAQFIRAEPSYVP